VEDAEAIIFECKYLRKFMLKRSIS